MRQLPLSALRAFEAAARTGSFREAAEVLSLSPSPVRVRPCRMRTGSFPISAPGGLPGPSPGEKNSRSVLLRVVPAPLKPK